METAEETLKIDSAELYLKHVRSLTLQIRSKRDQIEQQKSLLEPMGISYGEKIATSGSGDSLQTGVLELNDLIKEFCTDLVGYVEEYRRASNVIGCLSKPEYRAALVAYYLIGKTWEVICVELGYSWSGLMKLRKQALIEVYDYMPCTWG